MEAELVGLATSGATALVGLMVTDAWSGVRDRVSRFLTRSTTPGGGDGGVQAVVAGELEASRTELAAARTDGDDALTADIEAQWRIRLRRLLLQDPAAADELRSLLAELAPAEDRGGRTVGDIDLRGATGVQFGDHSTQHIY
ncbi:hypothetical protein AB0D29_10405 [Streptomyces sp. NPDC048424]|uniref:hypothetical protein n=1 Tax=Streptomyces sp. NPDC048424 TaxID=3155265 RepID=UPI00343D3AFB